MIWQERSGLIFMLCKYVEEQKEKCAEYLPTLVHKLGSILNLKQNNQFVKRYLKKR